MLSGNNLMFMEITMRKELLTLLYSHILSHKFDVVGGNRLLVDIEMYQKCCQINSITAEEEFLRRKKEEDSGNITWNLLKKMVGLLIIDVEQLPDAYPDIIKEFTKSSINIEKIDFTKFVERRHDYQTCKTEICTIWDRVIETILPERAPSNATPSLNRVHNYLHNLE